MARKPKQTVPDDPAEYARFLEAAKAAEASDDPKALDKAFKAVVPSKPPSKDRR